MKERKKDENLNIRCIPTSFQARQLILGLAVIFNLFTQCICIMVIYLSNKKENWIKKNKSWRDPILYVLGRAIVASISCELLCLLSVCRKDFNENQIFISAITGRHSV